MTTSLQNAPLVELIAELRWIPRVSPAAQGRGSASAPASPFDIADSEEFFRRFGDAVYDQGFKQMERLFPEGAQVPSDRVVCRYKHENKDTPMLVQAGSGIFSINALPPYKSWEDFRPWAENAISSLLDSQKEPGEFSVSVRYINAFKGAVLEGLSPTEFFDRKLGFAVNLPRALADKMVAGGHIQSTSSVVIPIEGMKMTVNFGDGRVRGEPAAIMDTVAAADDDEIAPEVGAIMSHLDRAHSVLHEAFFDLTRPIAHSLKPEGN